MSRAAKLIGQIGLGAATVAIVTGGVLLFTVLDATRNISDAFDVFGDDQ